jgi:riboflavin kinase/FMN adenylyltransferase
LVIPVDLVRLESLAPLRWPRPAVAVGNFDGVHRGHQALVAEALLCAREQRGTAVVLTFDPHPSRVLDPSRAPATLMTLGQKALALAALGVDRIAALPFTPTLAAAAPRQFARQVLDQALGVHTVIVGTNFRFGRDRAGDVVTLTSLGEEMGFGVRRVPPVLHGGQPISSSRIREALGRGDVVEAAALLGRPYAIEGSIRAGEGRGRTIGIPTANMHSINEIVPLDGVYACWFQTGERRHPAVTNIGRRPTFGAGSRTIESHLLDFQGDLYGQIARLEFVERLRAEQRFPGPEALASQIRADITLARERLARR